MQIVDVRTGSVRPADAVEVWLDPWDRVIPLASAATAIWTWSGSTLQLESFDGTVLRQWSNAASSIPQSSDDGGVLLVQHNGRWHLERDGRSEPVDVGSGDALVLRQDGEWFGYLEKVRDSGWYRIHAVEVATGRDVALREARACNCDGSFVLEWDAGGRLRFADFHKEELNLGVPAGAVVRL